MRIKPLVTAIVAGVLPGLALAQSPDTARDVQIRSVDFESQVVELHNFGSMTRDLDGWRFCTHDETDGFDYTGTSGLNGQSLAAGESLFVHWNDDAAGANAINVSSLGGAWVDSLSADGAGQAVSLGLYVSGPFGSPANMVDHVQYSFGGFNAGSPANARNSVATSASLWGSVSDWISIVDTTTSLLLIDDPFPGATGATHTSASYAAIPEPAAGLMLAFAAAGGIAQRRR